MESDDQTPSSLPHQHVKDYLDSVLEKINRPLNFSHLSFLKKDKEKILSNEDSHDCFIEDIGHSDEYFNFLIDEIISIIAKDENISPIDKMNIGQKLWSIKMAIMFLYVDLNELQRRNKTDIDKTRAKIARSGKPNLSTRNAVIFRAAKKALKKAPRLKKKAPYAVAGYILTSVNLWIEESGAFKEMKQDNIGKILSKNEREWR